MGRARLTWSVSLTLVIGLMWSTRLLAAAAAAEGSGLEAARLRVDYLRRIMLTDGYDKAGHRDPKWDAAAREAIGLYVKILGDDPSRTGDEADVALDASRRCLVAGCKDPAVWYVYARIANTRALPEGQKIRLHAGAAEGAMTYDGYPAMLRAQIFFRAADYAGRGGRAPGLFPGQPDVPNSLADLSKTCVKRGMELLPAALADRDASPKALRILFDLIGRASLEVEGDRFKLLTEAARIAEKSPVSKSLQLTLAAEGLIAYAWDARGGGYANTVTDDGWKLFRERVGAARAALDEAWRLDPSNAAAALGMLTIARAQSWTFDEMDRWYRRAIDADPTLDEAVSQKFEFLEPKWGGSDEAMLKFGRELLKAGRWETGQPLQLVEVHYKLLMHGDGPRVYFERCRAYFKNHPEAWQDVKAVYEAYLKRVPQSRYHRTRFAVIAGWCEQWKEADREFKALGENYIPLYPAAQYRALRAKAAEMAGRPEGN